MSWIARLRFWSTESRCSHLDMDPSVPLEVRIGTAESELRDITRDVYAVLRDARPSLHAER